MKTRLRHAEARKSPPFEDHVRAVVHKIRSTIADGLVVVGADATRPQAVSRLLGIDKSLTSKICRLVCDEDPVSAIPLIPGRSGLRILINALTKAGAPNDPVSAVRSAMEEFDRMVNVHSGDRETLEMMLGNVTRTRQQGRDETHRKFSFRGNSATWGVQARMQICTNFIAPGDEKAMVDIAWLSGLVDFRRLRRETPWAMAAARKASDDGTPLPVGLIQPIDAAYVHAESIPLMAEFCSKPIPQLRIEPGRDGVMRYELVEGPVGNTAAATCIIGLFVRNFFKRFRTPNDEVGEHVARLYTPVETLIHDIFIHRDLQYALKPRIALYSQMPGGPLFPTDGRNRGQLNVSEPTIDLGSSPPSAVLPEFPPYAKMVNAVFDRLKWNPADFQGYRFRMKYPPIPTLVLWRYDLPEAAPA